MIFDIASTMGTRRKYLMLNGVDISPFQFPNHLPTYGNRYSFTVSNSEINNSVTLTSGSNREEHLGGTLTLNLKECFKNENIKNYRKVCFVISFKNYYNGWCPLNYYGINSNTSNIQIGSSGSSYMVEDKVLGRMDDGKKVICEFDLKSFYNLDYIYFGIGRNTTEVPSTDNDSQLHIHAIYFE